MLAAEKNPVSGFVSISGVGKNAADLLKEQIGANPNNPQTIKDEANNIIDRLRSGEQVEHVSSFLALLFRPSVQPYLISWFRFDPSEEIRKLRIPVLVVQGDQDIQVSVEDAQRLLAASQNGQLLMIPDMTHTLKTVTTNKDLMKSYIDPSLPISKEMLDGIIAFIVRNY